MRVLILVLVVVAVAFAAVIAFGSLRSPDGGNPPPSDQESLEEGGWDPPNWTAALNAVMSPFAPGLEMNPPRVSVNAGTTADRQAPASDDELRVAKLALTSGRGIAVEYSCSGTEPGRDDKTCSQQVCLCTDSATFTAAEVDGLCTGGWRKRRQAGGGVRCGAKDSEAAVTVYSRGGRLRFRVLGTTGSAAAEFR